MTRSAKHPSRPLFLGIDGGGSHTIAMLVDARLNLLKRMESGPANVRLLNDRQMHGLFRSISTAFPRPDAIAIGLAGARSEGDWLRIRRTAGRIWASIPCHATNDLETALAAADLKSAPNENTRVLVLSGTGSCCYGRNSSGKTVKIGGWGHLLGDQGSGYQIALNALRAVVSIYDRTKFWPGLGGRLLNHLELNEPNELISWAQNAGKSDIAGLALEVFAARQSGDRMAAQILERAEERLAQDAIACAHSLTRLENPIQFVLAGGNLLKQPHFARRLTARLQKLWPGAKVSSLARESAWGAVVLARTLWEEATANSHRAAGVPKIARPKSGAIPAEAPLPILSPTEQRNARSTNLDKLPVSKAISLMLSEDAKIPAAILAQRRKIESAVRLIVAAFKSRGRLFYVGAGTSGRLGVLDASECPPTFRTAPEMVQGIIAGGHTALWRSIEGAEDDAAAGARAITFRTVRKSDVVVGIAASGRTPFVWGALAEARKRGAKTILVTFNPSLGIPASGRPNILIAPDVGPEILTGSTRLKAGTATKLILNIFTTLAMVQLGKVVGNLMVDLNPSNIKLRDRAVRIVMELCAVDYGTAKEALARSQWNAKRACAQLVRRVGCATRVPTRGR